MPRKVLRDEVEKEENGDGTPLLPLLLAALQSPVFNMVFNIFGDNTALTGLFELLLPPPYTS